MAHDNNINNNTNANNNKNNFIKEKIKRKNNNKNYKNIINSNYNNIYNFPNYPLLYVPYANNNFQYMPFGLSSNFNSLNNNIPAYKNTPPYNNYSISSINSSYDNTQESSSEDKNYENFGENYIESLQKGFKNISQIYNNNKLNRPRVSLLCNYYCNLDKTEEEEKYLNEEIKKFGDNLKKILNIE